MSAKPGGASRFPEVDVARGLAILAVVLYHFIYDLDALAGYNINSTSGFWGVFRRRERVRVRLSGGALASYQFLAGAGQSRTGLGTV